MNVADALYALVHDYAGGAKALAARIGMNVHVLYSKVNPNIKTHQPTIFEAMQWMALSGDHRTLRAQNEELGYLPPIPRVEVAVSDAALLETYTRLMSELGEFSTKFHQALMDGKLTVAEVDGLQTEMLEFFGAGEELLNRARQIAEG